MGSVGFWYFTEYRTSVVGSLVSLREREFEAGRYYPVLRMDAFPPEPSTPRSVPRHASIEQAVAAADSAGTRSILDITTIVDGNGVLHRVTPPPKPTARVLRELGNDPATGRAVVVLDGRWGPVVSDGEVKTTLRQGVAVEDVTITEASQWLFERSVALGRATTTIEKFASEVGVAKPISVDVLHDIFGTQHPLRTEVERMFVSKSSAATINELWGSIPRGAARYITCFADGEAVEMFFFGYTLD